MPSASRIQMARLAVLALCGLLLVGAATGCSTTQEKAERQQAQAKHILAARAERRRHMHKDDKSKKKHQDGSKKR